MGNIPIDAPACFAAATVFSHDSDVCRGCGVFEQCSSASLKTLEAIQNIVNVSDLLKRHAKARKVAQIAMCEADRIAAESLPPGNIDKPLPFSVDRKTEVATVKFEISEGVAIMIAKMPVKSQKLALSLCKTSDIDKVKSDLKEGRNALIEKGPGFIRVALDLLLRGGFSKREYREALQSELEWSEGTALSHVSMTLHVFAAFGIAQMIDNRFVLHPALS